MNPTLNVTINSTGEKKTVADSELPDLLASSDVTLPDTEFEVESPDGTIGTVPSQSLSDALSKGYTLRTSEQIRKEELEKKYGTATGQAEALALGAGQGLSFGLLSQALVKSGAYTAQELKDKEEANKGLYTTGEIVSTLAPAILSGGSSLVAKGAAKTIPGFVSRLAAEAGEAAAKKLAPGIVSTGAKFAVNGAIENAAIEVGQLIKEEALGDAELSAESILARAGRGAAMGGLAGGVLGAGSKAASRATNKVFQKIGNELDKAVEQGDLGVLKWAGAKGKELKQIFKSESLNPKDFSEYILDLTKGFDDTAEAIVANNGITKKGGENLLQTVTTKIEDVAANNQIAKQASQEMMGKATTESNAAYLEKLSKGEVPQEDLVYGSDIAKYLKEKFITNEGLTVDTRRGAVEKLITELSDLGVERNPLTGEVVGRVPMTPDDIRKQSVIFGDLGFEKDSNSLIAKAAKALRFKLEDDVIRLVNKADPSGELAKKYVAGKKLYQKSKLLEDMLQKKAITELSNNRGFSLTEAIMTTTGAVTGGIPGAVAAYGLRKAQREYGDIALTAILSKIGKRQEALSASVKTAADGFLKNASRGIRVNLALDNDVSDKDLKKTEKELLEFRSNPQGFIDGFVNNNAELFQAAPQTAQALQAKAVAANEFLDAKFPRMTTDSIGYEQKITRPQLMAFRDYSQAINNPQEALDKISKGYANQRYAEAIKTVYPKMWQEFVAQTAAGLGKVKNTRQRIMIGQFIGMKTAPVVNQQVVQMLQNGMSQQAAQAQSKGVQQKVPISAAKNIDSAGRAQSGLDRTLYRS